MRSAAGMAALSLLNQGEQSLAGYQMHDVLTISLRSVERFLAVGVGEKGAPIGHSAHDEMLELVVPFILAWQSTSGQNLAVGTGLERTGSWLALSDGLQLRSEGNPHWLTFSRLVARDVDQALLGWYAQQQSIEGGELWQKLWQKPDNSTAVEPDFAAHALKLFDQRAGVLASRSSWDDASAIINIMETGAANNAAATLQRSWLMKAFNQAWITSPSAPRGLFQWPEARGVNTMHPTQVVPATGAAIPAASGRVERAVAPGQSISLGQGPAFCHFKYPQWRLGNPFPWRWYRRADLTGLANHGR